MHVTQQQTKTNVQTNGMIGGRFTQRDRTNEESCQRRLPSLPPACSVLSPSLCHHENKTPMPMPCSHVKGAGGGEKNGHIWGHGGERRRQRRWYGENNMEQHIITVSEFIAHTHAMGKAVCGSSAHACARARAKKRASKQLPPCRELISTEVKKRENRDARADSAEGQYKMSHPPTSVPPPPTTSVGRLGKRTHREGTHPQKRAMLNVARQNNVA